LTFIQTSQLRRETSLINGNLYRHHVIPLTALENQVFVPVGPYSALIRPNQTNRAESLTFGQTSKLKLETRLVSTNCM